MVQFVSDRPAVLFVAAVASATAGWGARRAAAAPPYAFTRIADSAGELSTFGHPQINDAGDVSFWAVYDNRHQGIFTGRGAGVTTVARTDGDFSRVTGGDSVPGLPDIDNAGRVYFAGTHRALGPGVFVASGGTVRALVDDAGPYAGPFGFDPAVTGAGTVAVTVTADSGGLRVVRIEPDGRATPIAAQPGDVWVFGAPSISNAGSVAWYAGRPTGENTYMRGNGDEPFETVYTAGQFGIGSLDDSPVVDSSGTLAFMSHTASGQAIFLGDGGPPITFADTAGPFRSFAGYQGYDSPALNDRGTVVFYAELDDGRAGIFVGPDAAEDAVIRTGDALFGSVVTNLRYFKALSDNDDIAFNYTLANGLTGIAVTRVPEPSDAAIAFVGALSVLSRRRPAKR